jgi:hypothetical protein
MNPKLLRGLIFGARGRGDRIPQRLRYLVEPIAPAGNISHVLPLLFVDHSVPLSVEPPGRVDYELPTVVSTGQSPLTDFCARPVSLAASAIRIPLRVTAHTTHLGNVGATGLRDFAWLMPSADIRLLIRVLGLAWVLGGERVED